MRPWISSWKWMEKFRGKWKIKEKKKYVMWLTEKRWQKMTPLKNYFNNLLIKSIKTNVQKKPVTKPQQKKKMNLNKTVNTILDNENQLEPTTSFLKVMSSNSTPVTDSRGNWSKNKKWMDKTSAFYASKFEKCRNEVLLYVGVNVNHVDIRSICNTVSPFV